jgi:hypothetical protein
MVDDNFHYMDESERWELGVFSTAEEALEACRRLVDRSLLESYKDGATADELFDDYKSFGDDPFIIALEDAPRVSFSAWTYARQRASELTTADPKGLQQRQTILGGKPNPSEH